MINKFDLKLVEYPAESLLIPSVEVEINETTRDFCIDFIKFYHELRKNIGANVAGLSAPQVGINSRIFIALGHVYINPVLVWIPKEGTQNSKEGCLSLPHGQYYDLKRPYGCTLKWSDIDGSQHEKRFNGHMCSIIMHEMDHLEGKLCNHGLEK